MGIGEGIRIVSGVFAGKQQSTQWAQVADVCARAMSRLSLSFSAAP